jgi:hypothetical protein
MRSFSSFVPRWYRTRIAVTRSWRISTHGRGIVELFEAARDRPPVLAVEDLIVLAMAWPPWVCVIGSRLC